MPNFTPQLGDTRKTGLNPLEQRFVNMKQGENPYVTGSALPLNYPVFSGRDSVLHSICGKLLSPDKPQSVSVLGELRSAKSSLLNQVVQRLREADTIAFQRS